MDSSNPSSFTDMFDPSELLKDIELKGSASADSTQANPIVMGSRANIGGFINLSGGLPKFRKEEGSRFSLTFSQPLALSAYNPLEIKCCLCGKVIIFPAWYREVKYAVNHFHYFVCFNPSDTSVTARCFRR